MKELDIPETLRNKMKEEIQKCDAAVALEECKRRLVARQYEEALVELERANVVYRSRKLQFLLYLMRTMPGLVRHMYLKQQNRGMWSSGNGDYQNAK